MYICIKLEIIYNFNLVIVLNNLDKRLEMELYIVLQSNTVYGDLN